MSTTIGMLEEAFASFGKLLDHIPNFEQRKRKKYFKTLEMLEEAKEDFIKYTSQPMNQMNSDVVLGMKDHIKSVRQELSNLQKAFVKELEK